jgi:putative PIN family toxin of toxin-antitoxin system
LRITLDSNILVRAVASPQGPALRLLDIVLRSHTPVLSRFILDEVERVLLYPRLQARYRITAKEAARFTGNLANVAHLVEPAIVRPLVLSDPADDAVLYTAADGKAEGRSSLYTKSSALRFGRGTEVLRGLWHPPHDRSGVTAHSGSIVND